jgi:hypothetical protein
LPKRHNDLESPTVYVLITDNKFDFYNITEIADKKYKILDRALKNIIVKRIFYNTSIGTFFDKRIGKVFRKIQIQISGYNR